MKIDSLINYFIDKISADNLISEIDNDVSIYKTKAHIKGTSMPIQVENGSRKLSIGKKELLSLCNLYLNARLSNWHLYYLCDVILLSESFEFENDLIYDTISSMTDPEINGEVSIEMITKIRDSLL
jgi:hypothetical protein